MVVCTRPQDQASQQSSAEGQKIHEPQSLAEELVTLDGDRRWENQFSLRLCPSVRQSCSCGWPCTHEYMDRRNRIQRWCEVVWRHGVNLGELKRGMGMNMIKIHCLLVWNFQIANTNILKLYVNSYSIICDSQKMETTHASVNWWIDKEYVVHGFEEDLGIKYCHTSVRTWIQIYSPFVWKKIFFWWVSIILALLWQDRRQRQESIWKLIGMLSYTNI